MPSSRRWAAISRSGSPGMSTFLPSTAWALAEGGNPVVHVGLELVGGPEGIDAHGPEKMAQALAHGVGRGLQEGHEGRHPRPVVGPGKHGREDIDHRAQAVALVRAGGPAQGQQRAAVFHGVGIGAGLAVGSLGPAFGQGQCLCAGQFRACRWRRWWWPCRARNRAARRRARPRQWGWCQAGGPANRWAPPAARRWSWQCQSCRAPGAAWRGSRQCRSGWSSSPKPSRCLPAAPFRWPRAWPWGPPPGPGRRRRLPRRCWAFRRSRPRGAWR